MVQRRVLAELVSLLVAEGDNSTGSSDDAFFKEVLLASPSETLRRASLILAGRLPNDEEIALANFGDDGLKNVIGLMQGDSFHEFLIRGANDRLHTDAFVNGSFSEVSG